MSTTKVPKRLFSTIQLKFSWEGFYKLDVLSALVEIGFSRAEAKRRMGAGAIKIWDTRLTQDGNHYEWFKRPAREVELVEPNDIFLVGRFQSMTIAPIPFSALEKLYYHARAAKEKIQDRIEDFNIWAS